MCLEIENLVWKSLLWVVITAYENDSCIAAIGVSKTELRHSKVDAERVFFQGSPALFNFVFGRGIVRFPFPFPFGSG